MDVSCHSFVRMAKLALPLMRDGGSLATVSFYGTERVVEHYNLMRAVKAALEACVRRLAVDLAERRIHVHVIYWIPRCHHLHESWFFGNAPAGSKTSRMSSVPS